MVFSAIVDRMIVKRRTINSLRFSKRINGPALDHHPRLSLIPASLWVLSRFDKHPPAANLVYRKILYLEEVNIMF